MFNRSRPKASIAGIVKTARTYLGLAQQLVAVFRRVVFHPVNEKTGWKPILCLQAPKV